MNEFSFSICVFAILSLLALLVSIFLRVILRRCSRFSKANRYHKIIRKYVRGEHPEITTTAPNDGYKPTRHFRVTSLYFYKTQDCKQKQQLFIDENWLLGYVSICVHRVSMCFSRNLSLRDSISLSFLPPVLSAFNHFKSDALQR